MYCPNKQCGQFLPMPETKTELCDAICPNCDTWVCTQCKVQFHEGITCEVYQALPDTEKQPEDVQFSQLAKKEHWKRCPN